MDCRETTILSKKTEYYTEVKILLLILIIQKNPIIHFNMRF